MRKTQHISNSLWTLAGSGDTHAEKVYRVALLISRLTFDTGLDLTKPFPTSMAEQSKSRVFVAHHISLSADIVQFVTHFKSSVTMKNCVWEGRRIPAWLA